MLTSPRRELRGSGGKWVKGYKPSDAKNPAIHDANKALVVEMLERGETIKAIAERIGCSKDAVYAATRRDDDIRRAFLVSQEIRRARVAEILADTLDSIADAALRTASNPKAKARERKEAALSTAIALDAHAKAAGILTANPTLAVQINVPGTMAPQDWEAFAQKIEEQSRAAMPQEG